MRVSFAHKPDRKLQIVVTGTGRSGTGFAARWLTSVGLPTGHELFFDYRGLGNARRLLAVRDFHIVGESAWEAAPHLGSEPLRDALVVHQVRHPKQMIESCLRQPPGTMPRYLEYLEKHLPRAAGYKSVLNKAACRWVYWNRMIEMQTQGRECFFWRVEDGTDGLLRWLDTRGLVNASKIVPAQQFSNTRHNHKSGPDRKARLDAILPELRFELESQMRMYGYDRWE